MANAGHPPTPLESPSSVFDEKSHSHYPDDGHDQKVQALYSPNAKRRARNVIIAAFAVAAVFAFGHHVFLSILDGRLANNQYLYLQKVLFAISNTFAKIVAICLGLVVISSLTQATWYFVGSSDAPVNLISDVFSLPSSLSLLSLLRRSWKLQLVAPISLALLAQSLLVVSTFAPNALTIATKRSTTTAPVPVLDPSAKVFKDYEDDPFMWDDTVTYLMDTALAESWNVPAECETSGCSFDISYQAPGISCSDLNPSDIPLQSYSPQMLQNGGNWTFYNASLSNDTDSSSSYDLSFSISYIPMVAQVSTTRILSLNETSSASGVSCVLQNMQYIAHFDYTDDEAQVTTEVTNSKNNFTDNCNWDDITLSSAQCQQYANNSEGALSGFVSVFEGIFRWQANTVNSTVYDEFAIKDFFQYTNDAQSGAVTFIAESSIPMRQALEQRFANITLGILLNFNQTRQESVHAQIPDTWQYRSWYLWIVYGPAILLVFIAGLYGLHYNRNTSISMEKTFSSILIATRSKRLDILCAQSFDGIMASTLRHDRGTGYYLLQSDPRGTALASPTEAKEVEREALTQTTTYAWTRVIIITAFLAAVAACLGHHFWLASIDGFIVDPSQRWIKNSTNVFSHAVAICLTIASAFSLTQACWRHLKRHGTRVHQVDDLFALPSPQALANLVFSHQRFQMVYLIAIAFVMQALVLITILAPLALNAYIIERPDQTIDVPGLNLSSQDYSTSSNFSSIWDGMISRLTIASPKYTWTIPPECAYGDYCSFGLQYQAPALSCRTPEQQELTVTPYNTSMAPTDMWVFYDSSVSQLDSERWNGTSGNLPLLINYVSMSSSDLDHGDLAVNITGGVQGILCECMDGTYQANFTSVGNTVDVFSTLLRYENNMTETCDFANSADQNMSNACYQYAQNSLAICSSFALNFEGQLGWIPDEDYVFSDVMNNVIFDEIMVYGRGLGSDGKYTLAPRVANLSATMVDLFTNLTLGLLPTLGATVDEDVSIDGVLVWRFEAATLWAIYAPALTAVLGVVFYGLYCINDNGMAMDNKFATFLITTRTDELDRVYNAAHDHALLMETKLIYDKKGRFVVDSHQDSSATLGYA